MAEDFGAIADKLKGLLEGGGSDKLLDLLGGGEPKRSESKSSGLDVDTIMRFKNAYDSVSSRPDPRVSLLTSLKPYMNGRRASELDRVVNLLSLTKISDVVKTFKGGI